MNTNEALKQFENNDFLNQIYQFSYKRCSTGTEAEDLCSEIILSVLSAIQKQTNILEFHAFVWTIAHRVYADYCAKRSKNSICISLENTNQTLMSRKNEIDDLVNSLEESRKLQKIFMEISYLSKAYRDVMILYYLDELSIKEITQKLNISETTVKQRLFYARNSIRKEVNKMNERNLSLKPIRLDFIGTGNPLGNDPRIKAERMLSQNLVYLCKDKAKSAKDLSDELCIPMPYIEEELEIQCHGENGSYGLLKKLDNGKYISNILVVDYKEFDESNNIYERHLPEFCDQLKKNISKHKEELLSFPYLSKQDDTRFILWTLISGTIWYYNQRIIEQIDQKYFSEIIPSKRDFTSIAIAFPSDKNPEMAFYGCDGINATAVGGYERIYLSNVYGERITKHFECGHNISQDANILMTLKALNGINILDLSDAEKEVAAKAIEAGYLQKKGDMIEPKIIILKEDDQNCFNGFSEKFCEGLEPIINQIAAELSQYMRTHIPPHLLGEYQYYPMLIAGVRILSDAIEACIQADLLTIPNQTGAAEGILMTVK
ncbi:MAG: RNA polymerase sigma factor [Eubacterium sp.]|nr:RNA polymerase sigma factor [Eubacterium sp.]